MLTAARDGVYVADLEIPVDPALQSILEELRRRGHKALVVGGAVRDAVMGIEPKDIDVEVYGPGYDELSELLSGYGRADVVGKSFGVVKLHTPSGEDYDFSVPRRDSKVGEGHRGIQVEVDHGISPKEAAQRRDFTMNALAYDPLSGELHDYYGGIDDLKNGVLRATSKQFKEDPLRVLRGMQFAARYNLRLDPDTARMASEVADEYHSLSKERVAEEWMKLASKGKYPGKALEFLRDTGWLKHYPHIEALFGVPQDPEWHPEGWSHGAADPDRVRHRDVAESSLRHPKEAATRPGSYVSRPGGNSEMVVTVDVPQQYYAKYVDEEDGGERAPASLAESTLRHLVLHYGVAGSSRRPEVTYLHVDSSHAAPGSPVEITVGYRDADSGLVTALLEAGCPRHSHIIMGDVAKHTEHVMNEAARIADREGLKGDERAALVFAALGHDFAKPQTTAFKQKPSRGMSVTSPGHEEAGAPMVEDFLRSIGVKSSIVQRVRPMVKRHLAHIGVKPTKENIRRLAHDLHPSSIEDLTLLVEADHSGRPPLAKGLPEQARRMLQLARQDGVSAGRPAQLIQGRHVMPYYGGAGGKHIGEAVGAAYNAYLSGRYDDEQGGMTWLDNHLQSKANMLTGADVLALGVQPGPEVGRILGEAWQQQVAGRFTDKSQALSWLSARVSGNT